MRLPDPLAPYANAIKWGLIAVLCIGLVGGGARAGCSYEANQARDTIAEKDRALLAAGESLRASGAALRAVNAEADRQIAAARKAETEATAAGVAAKAAEKAEKAKNEEFAKRLARAGKNRPSCAAILSLDVVKECGL